MSNQRVLTDKLNEICLMNWNEYMAIHNDKSLSAFTHTVIALVDLCCKPKPKIFAIREAFNRISGKPEKTIIIKTPKQYVIYPYAERIASAEDRKELAPAVAVIENTSVPVDNFDTSDEEMPTANLRKALRLIVKLPLDVCEDTLMMRDECEKRPVEDAYAPKVGAVIVSNLLVNGVHGNALAILELFDQIDGKMADIINVGGTEPIYITDYSLTAPPDAIKNSDGIYFIEKKIVIRGVELDEPEQATDDY